MKALENRHLRNAALLLVLAGLLFFLHWAFLEDIDVLAYDFSLRLRGEQAADPRIVIIAVDDGSLEEVGPWPWSSEQLRRLFRYTLEASPAVFGIDLILSRPLHEYFPAKEALSPLARPVVLASSLGVVRTTAPTLELGWQRPDPIPAGASLGHIHAAKDSDGVCRSIPLTVTHSGRREWAFALQVARVFLDLPESALRFRQEALQLGDSIAIPRLSTPIHGATDSLGVLPSFQGDHLLLNSRGGIGTFPYVPAASVLRGTPEVLTQLEGKIVLFGATAYSLGDHLATAFSGSAELPGIEIHANAVDTILNTRFLRTLSETQEFWFLLVSLTLFWLFFSYSVRGRSLWIFAAVLLFATLTPLLLFFLQGLWIPLVSTVVAVVMAGSTSQFIHYSLLNRRINRRFSHLARLLRESRISKKVLDTPTAGGRSPEWKLELLGDATEAALQLSRERDSMMSFVSHELKTPLTSIRGFADLLSRSEFLSESDRREALQLIQWETERLSKLVNDYLQLSRLEHQSISLEKNPIQLEEVTDRVISTLQPQAREKSIEIVTTFDETPAVAGDREVLTQVILNLLGNAVKYSPDSSRIEVRTGYDQRGVRLEVNDEGSGIREEDLERIFDKFYRIGAHEQDAPGSGLGLAFSQEAIQQHGGRIEVESHWGEGSTFRILLPRLAAE